MNHKGHRMQLIPPVRVARAGLAFFAACVVCSTLPAENLHPKVEVEEVVYRFEDAKNGSSQMWCHGNTSLVRLGDQVYASGRETIPNAKPLNNCLTSLYRRDAKGWTQVFKSDGRTREPSPIAITQDGSVYLSVNPTLTPTDTYNGSARPEILLFDHDTLLTRAPKVMPTQTLLPTWDGQPKFSEHSYRSFAADGPHGDLILFQNEGYTHSEWAFRNGEGNWSATGKLVWPDGKDYEKPQPIRVCYPNVAVQNRAVYFCGVSDIMEPNPAWRAYKLGLTGQHWDYDFRRLFFTWCPDITSGHFTPWIEVASREETCGRITPCDLYVESDGRVRILWLETALDERLREKFFPEAKQRYALMSGVIEDRKVVSRTTVSEGGEGLGGLRPGYGRFHETQDGRLFAFYYVGGKDKTGQALNEHRIVEMGADGPSSKPVSIEMKTPLTVFFTSTPRAGCQPSNLLDIYGSANGAMHYARIRLVE